MFASKFRIYVSSLADYKDGRLYGSWFILKDFYNCEDLQKAVNNMLFRSPCYKHGSLEACFISNSKYKREHHEL